MSLVKLVVKQILLNIKIIFSSKLNLIFILFFVGISITLPIIFIPFWIAAGMPFLISLIPTIAIVYSSSDYKFRKSTLYKNTELTINNKWIFHLSTLITVILFAIMTSSFVFIVLSIAGNFNLLLMGWLSYADVVNGKATEWYTFSFSLYFIVIYASLQIAFLIYGISFLCQHLISSEKGYFTLILSILILTIIFGGSLNDYYLEHSNIVKYDDSLFPWNIYWFSALFPFYMPGQLIGSAASIGRVSIDSEGIIQYHSWFNTHDTLYPILFGKENNVLWNWSLSIPYFEIITFFILGYIISKFAR